LQKAIQGTGAERVFVTHGQVHTMVRWLCEQGLDAQGFSTEYGEEAAEAEAHLPEDASGTPSEGNEHPTIDKATV
jgi:putative mRNA 3-end processing factor